MRKAINTGIFAGIIISVFFVGAPYIRAILPDTVTSDILFFTVFFGCIATTLWLSLNYYCKSSAVKWSSLNITSIITSIIAAMMVSIAGFIYTRFIHPGYLGELVKSSGQDLPQKNFSSLDDGEWTWFKTPVNFALYNFQDIIIVLFLFSLLIAALYYARNRNRLPGQINANHHELIF